VFCNNLKDLLFKNYDTVNCQSVYQIYIQCNQFQFTIVLSDEPFKFAFSLSFFSSKICCFLVELREQEQQLPPLGLDPKTQLMLSAAGYLPAISCWLILSCKLLLLMQ
jgi:hypothetical protein